MSEQPPKPTCGDCGHALVMFCPSCRAKRTSPKKAAASRENLINGHKKHKRPTIAQQSAALDALEL